MPTVAQSIHQWRAAFAAAGVDSPRLTIELLLAHVTGLDRGALIGMGNHELTPAQSAQLQALCARRAAREPLAYLLGHWDFYGRRFAVKPGVLIPRPETEAVIDLARKLLPPGAQGWAADAGCGSGALAVTLALEFPHLRVVATDLHPTPLQVTAENARALGVSSRLALVRMDALTGLKPAALFDLMVSNPPYVTPQDYPTLQPEVRDFEPQEALVGGQSGLIIPETIVHQAAARLKPGGWLILEHGMEQGAALRQAATSAGYKDIRTEKDFAGLDRILVAQA
ncbi:MAG: peptide chain release factor N(5)-glutamine methyltransferase [Planctomycetes bacterium]|nr:peptide chain release factor N(5)-glutamine methyltransferase [Planctomycetota bacterium]